MVKGLIKIAGKAMGKAKSVLFADPKLLYQEERHLSNKPFFFEGSSDEAVLLVHGWTSTPYELRRLGKYLNENDYSVSGIQLAGHGTVPEDIENMKWQTWFEEVKAEYLRLKKIYKKVYVGGTSLGASLTMMLAKQDQSVDGIILMATPYKIRQEKVVLLFAKTLLLFGQKYRKKFYPPTFGLSSTVTRLISYQTYPVASAIETFNLIKESRKNLEKISQPCLLLQSTHDHVVAKNSMEQIFKRISSERKKKIYISRAYHTFISDIKNEHVFRDILAFLNAN